jgi:hypothetical protein
MIANGRGFFIDQSSISYAEAMNYARSYPEAVRYLRKGRGLVIGSYILAGAGGFVAGWGLGTMIRPKDDFSTAEKDVRTSTALLLGGGVVIAGAFGMGAIGIGQYKKAARAYNSAAFAGVRDYKMLLSPAVTSGGLGLQLTF